MNCIWSCSDELKYALTPYIQNDWIEVNEEKKKNGDILSVCLIVRRNQSSRSRSIKTPLSVSISGVKSYSDIISDMVRIVQFDSFIQQSNITVRLKHVKSRTIRTVRIRRCRPKLPPIDEEDECSE